MSRIFYDCEFLEDGSTIELISIGLVADDGREYYAVSSDVDFERVKANDWLLRNVVPSLPITDRKTLDRFLAHPGNFSPRPSVQWVGLNLTDTCVRPRQVIANEVRDFILTDPKPELWAYYGAYDHVALCQLWGRMIDLPDGVPMFTNDIKQECERLGNPKLPDQEAGEHNALADARHNKVMFDFLAEHERECIAALRRVR